MFLRNAADYYTFEKWGLSIISLFSLCSVPSTCFSNYCLGIKHLLRLMPRLICCCPIRGLMRGTVSTHRAQPCLLGAGAEFFSSNFSWTSNEVVRAETCHQLIQQGFRMQETSVFDSNLLHHVSYQDTNGLGDIFIFNYVHIHTCFSLG